MKLWQVAPFFHSLLVRFVNWKEKRQLCIFSFQITNLTKSEWKKRGNLSEFHSERNYYIQNWYFRVTTYMELWEKSESYPLGYFKLKNWGHTSWKVRTTFDFEVHKSTKVCFDRRHPLFALSYVLKLFFYKNCLLS